MSRIVLDASAVLALLLGEPGAEKVQALLADGALSTVNLSEVAAHFARNGVGENDIRRVLDPLPFERIAFDNELAYAAAKLLPTTRAAGLSLGDRACLALAQLMGVPAVTADRSWRAIARTVGVRIELIR
jgi:PIN domain nuclease of toxin-antitoxin system